MPLDDDWSTFEFIFRNWINDDLLDREIEDLELFNWDDLSESLLFSDLLRDNEYRFRVTSFLQFLAEHAIIGEWRNLASLIVRIYSIVILCECRLGRSRPNTS